MYQLLCDCETVRMIECMGEKVWVGGGVGGRERREDGEVVGRGACVTVSQSGIQSESQRE